MCAAIALFLCTRQSTAQVIINEFMADNLSIFPDNHDYDDFSDWIELHNITGSAIDLTGFCLTDNLGDPTKWPIPEGTTIPARGFLVLRADGFDDRPGMTRLRDSYPWDTTFTTLYYHTSFKLAKEGEEIGLYRIDGTETTAVDIIRYTTQLPDVSSGRNPYTGTYDLYRFDLPTPGAPNTTDGKLTEQFSGNVTFSIPGGFYGEAQTVLLATPSGAIHYTVDGSLPTIRSAIYTAPLRIDSTTVLRARCVERDRLAGKISTNTYFINEKTRDLMVVAIAADPSFLFNEENGVWTHSLKKREWPTSFELFTPDGRQVVNVNGGMTLGSLSNFTMPQKPLQFKCRNEYGDDYVWHRIFKKRIACHRRLRLRQGGDSWDGNMIADGMLESICDGQMELGMQAYRPVVVYFNGAYYGIEALREQFDDQFFINNYGIDPTTKEEVRTTIVEGSGRSFFGNIRETWELVSGGWDNYRELITLALSGSMDDGEKYGLIRERVDINSCIDFFCAVVYGSQITWTHNQDLWKVAGGKWRWLIADYDRAFNPRNVSDNLFNESFMQPGGIIPSDTLFTALMAISKFRDHFAQRFAAHLNSTFAPVRLYGIIDSLHAMLLPEMEDHTDRWRSDGGIPSVSEWEWELSRMKDFIDERTDIIYDHLAAVTFNPQGTSLLSIDLEGSENGEVYINDVRMCSRLDSLRFFSHIPLRITVVPKPGYVFTGWDNGSSNPEKAVILTCDKVFHGACVKAKTRTVVPCIDADTKLVKTDYPYAARGDITVEKGATFILGKGVTLLMPQGADITVKGRLIVKGTPDAPVVIRENYTAGAHNWGALTFDNASDTNSLQWLEISGTTLGNDPLNQRAGINGNGSHVAMDHLTMRNTVYPLYFEGGSTVIRNSTVTVDHICNGAIHIGRGAATVENCTWISTGVTINTDAIDIKGVADGIVRSNRIYNFNGYNSDAIDLGESSKNIRITGNIIYGSCDKGISVGGKSTAVIENNIIVGCDIGIGIKDDSSHADIDHTTLVRNRIGIAVYAKVFGRGGGSAHVSNCILAASKTGSFYKDSHSSIQFSHCLSDVDTLPGTANLLDDPLFIDLFSNNFELQEHSPVIDNGVAASPDDIDAATTIGADYRFDPDDFPAALVPPVSAPPLVINEIMFNDSGTGGCGDWIELYNPSDSEVSLENWKFTDHGDYTSWETAIDIADIDTQDIYTFPAGTKLEGGGFVVIAADRKAFTAVHPDLAKIIDTMPFRLKSAETLLLFDNEDRLVTAVSYRPEPPWPVSPDGNGPSFELIDAAGLNYHPRNWKASAQANGSPGRPNTVSPPSPLHGPLTYSLAQNRPNPCRGFTAIRYNLPEQAHVTIDVFDLSGRHRETLVSRKTDAGYHTLTWNTGAYSPGIYLYRIRAGRFVTTRRVTIQ